MSNEVEENYILEERHHKFVNKLKVLCRNVPVHFRSKMNGKFLSEFANSLLDKTVFDILKNLQEIQDMTEISLLENRMKLISSHKVTRNKLIEQHKEALNKEYTVKSENVVTLRLRQFEELKKFDKWEKQELNSLDQKNIMEFDQCVSEQQQTLERVQVPGFFVTNDPDDIRFQMYLLRFIITLSNMDDEGEQKLSSI